MVFVIWPFKFVCIWCPLHWWPREILVCIQLPFIVLYIFMLNSWLLCYFQINTRLSSTLWLSRLTLIQSPTWSLHFGDNGFISSLNEFSSLHNYHPNPLLLVLCKTYTIFLLYNTRILLYIIGYILPVVITGTKILSTGWEL